MENGTIVSIRRRERPYNHYAVMDGDNCIHVNKRRGIISSDPLWKVLRNAERFEIIEEDLETRQRNYERARAQIDTAYSYSFIGSNCESWINEIRYNDPSSHQVDSVLSKIALFSLFFL